MFKKLAMYALPLVAIAALAVPQLGAAEVRDRAGLFSKEAVNKAEAQLDRIERRTRIPVVIETIDAIPGLGRDASSSEKRTAVNRLAGERARELGYEGVYLLISKRDQVFSRMLVKERYESFLPEEKRDEVRDTLNRQFKSGKFDQGLLATTAILDGALSEAPAANGVRRAVPGMPVARRGEAHGAKFGLGTLLTIGLGIFGVLLLIRVLSGAFGRGGGYTSPMGMGGMPGPGMGPGPGYGPGYGGGYGAPRGGFFSGMLGGLGGALAGNWLYDQFSGGHGGYGQSDAAAYPPAESPADRGGDDFVGGNDDGGQGTSWADPGGDTGGGDWGGGDGGGDWGGGGGDWGGGGGDGGGW